MTVFFDYSPEIRKVIYTTNAIESLNYSLRRMLKNRGSFPNDDSILKILYLAINRVSKKWTMPIRNWTPPVSQGYLQQTAGYLLTNENFLSYSFASTFFCFEWNDGMALGLLSDRQTGVTVYHPQRLRFAPFQLLYFFPSNPGWISLFIP